MPAGNMGFSAMLAEEYVLIVPFAYQLQFQLPNKTQLHIVTSALVILLGFRSG
jgi:glycopeptide antibiotics resistance protein